MPSLVLIGPVVLEKIFKWTHPIFTFCDYLPFEADLALYLNKLESLEQTWIPWTNLNPLHPRIICTKFDWFWPAGSGEDFFLNFSVFLLFCYYLPLEKGYPLPLKTLESSPSKDDLCQVWLKLVQRFWRRSQKCKSLQTDGRTDDGQRAIRIAHLSFQLRWAKNALSYLP